tara:strand:+ start:462 stop:746 length:285 start_codon:yes stop_codon:yes gene_type:complete
MNWRELISKRKQIRDKSRQKPQTRMSGGKPSITPVGRTDDPSFDSMFGERLDNLAEMTREDLVDAITEKIYRMSKEELIEILERTQGNLMEAKI